MAILGYHCSHEQYLPSELLRNVAVAERNGFQAAMCSDHFHPWSERQGNSGFAWSWLGAALAVTRTVADALVYSLPAKPPMVLGTCLSPETAAWVGSWADGMITARQLIAPRDARIY